MAAWEAAVAQMGSFIRAHVPAAQLPSQQHTLALPEPYGAWPPVHAGDLSIWAGPGH